MIKLTFSGAFIFALLAGAAQAETLFDGILKVTNVNSACAGHVSIGDRWSAQYHPGSVTGATQSAPDYALNEYGPNHAVSFHLLAGTAFSSTFKSVANKSIGWTDYTPAKPSAVRVTAQWPATIANTTPGMTLQGQIKNPTGEVGFETCTADFNFAGVNDQQ